MFITRRVFRFRPEVYSEVHGFFSIQETTVDFSLRQQLVAKRFRPEFGVRYKSGIKVEVITGDPS